MRRLVALLLLFTTIAGISAVMAQQVHIVQRGENLSIIARKYGRTLQEVARANGIGEPYIIHAGNQISIPAAGGASSQSRPQAQAQAGFNAQAAMNAQAAFNSRYAAKKSVLNCCGLDRTCHTDEEWRAGYEALVALECWDEYVLWKRTPDPNYMPASGSDNCCTAPGWLCLEADHFRAGYEAFIDYEHCAPQVRVSYSPILETYYDSENCCHFGRNCRTDQDWVDGYHAYQRNECPPPAPDQPFHPVQPVQLVQPAQPASVAAPGVDNCCFLGWQCQTDKEWVDGYYAYQANQCAASQPAAATVIIPEGVDNCCSVNRECSSDREFRAGREAFQLGLCYVPSIAGPISIQGPADYIADTKRGLQWLLTHGPKWYKYVIDVIRVVKKVDNVTGANVTPSTGVMRSQYWSSPATTSPDLDPGQLPVLNYGDQRYTQIAMLLVHEACHVHAYKDGKPDTCHDDDVPYGIADALNDIDVNNYYRDW